ncbi:MAG: efflux RND transporter permease subunit [Magnetospiraceae bacterium]
MKALVDVALGRSRTVIATLILILVAGAYSYQVIPKESDPDINIPIIYVSMHHEGISPEDAERLLIRPMEQELRTIEGVKEMRSTGFEGGANVLLEFDAGFDADTALDDVREKVDTASAELPDATDEPTVNEVNFSLFPVLVVILSGEVPERTLVRLAGDLQDEIEGISTVLKADIAGDREEMVEALIDPVKVESYGLVPSEVAGAVGSANQLIAAGAQDSGQGRFTIKVPGLFENIADIMALPIKVDGDAVVTVGDVAQVRRTFKDPESFARVDGERAVALEVSKRTGENIIDTIENIRAVVEKERASWPESLQQAVTVSYSQDKSDDIRTMLGDLQNSVLMAVLLVMIVIVAALGWRTGILVGIAIPGSFLAAILLLFGIGTTVNIVVLFSLILAVGMLVDGAIVVNEYADRKMSEGLSRAHAYSLAAKRMFGPITASTLTTLAAFLPLVFWPGVVGEFMKYLPLTLLLTLSASLLMALIFVPTLGSIVGKPGAVGAAALKALAAGESGDLKSIGGMTGAYLKVLSGALRFPGTILVVSVALLIGVQVAYGVFGKGVEFFPDIEPSNAIVQVRAQGNLSIFEKDALMREVESRVLDVPGAVTVYTRTGAAEQSDEAEDIIGNITFEFSDWRERPPAAEIMADIRERTADISGIHIDIRKQEEGPPTGKPIHVQLSARDPDSLDAAVATVRDGLEKIPGMENIEDSRPLPGITWELQVDRAQAAKFGVGMGDVGNMIQMTTGGYKMGDYRPNDTDDEIDIRVRFPTDRRTVAELDQIRISTDNGAVPIGNFVKRVASPKVGTVKRVDGFRSMSVKADLAEGLNVDAKLHEVQAMIESLDLDPRINVAYKGENEEQAKAQAFLGKAFLVALFIMAIILVTQFNSFYYAALTLSAVVMSTIGVFIGLMVTHQAFGIVMCGIGVIALAGIVVNNNIVLIDTYARLKETTADAMEAVLRTGAQRLRPVMLTTTTTMLGLLPMMFGLNVDFITREVTVGAPSTQWWAQLATVIVFGLGFATLLTLVVTPCALMLQANWGSWRERRRHRKLMQRKQRGGGAIQPAS